jgi:CheY-like chemotaxis protein
VEAASDGSGQGATFTVALPRVEDEAGAESPGISLGSRTLAPVLSGRRILVVDDEPDVRDLLRHIFVGEGAVVEATSSVAEAVAAFEASPPDVVVTDIGMSGEDGYDLLRRLRGRRGRDGREIPVVALTAYVSPDDVARMNGEGFRSHLAKPVVPEAVIEALAAALAER